MQANERIHYAAPTPAQQARLERIVRAATALVDEGGEAALHMKVLAVRAEVSLSTSYRYFPSKDLLLIALSVMRLRDVLRDARSGRQFAGSTAGERAAEVLLRAFAVAQREPCVAAALSRVASEDSLELRSAL